MSILMSNKSALLTKFLSLARRDLPKKMTDEEARAYRLGLKQGWSEGLKDGVDLGFDVGLNALLGDSDAERAAA